MIGESPPRFPILGLDDHCAIFVDDDYDHPFVLLQFSLKKHIPLPPPAPTPRTLFILLTSTLP